MPTTPSSDKPLHYRLVTRLAEYTTTGVGTFIIDLALVWACLRYLSLNESIAIGLSFMIAMHANYLAQRYWVYRQSPEKTGRTYTYFMIIAGLGALLIPALVALLQQTAGLELFLARIIVGTLIGLIGFTFNTFFNFKFL